MGVGIASSKLACVVDGCDVCGGRPRNVDCSKFALIVDETMLDYVAAADYIVKSSNFAPVVDAG